MNASGAAEPLRPYAAIDRLIRGEGFTSKAAVARTARYHQALAEETPLCQHAASALLSRPGANVAVFTGFVVPEFFPQGENDGPLGALTLARALHRIGFTATIFVDAPLVETGRWIGAEIDCDVPVRAIDPISPPSCDLAIAIEKPGANPAGVLHTHDGRRIEGGSASIDAFFETHRKNGTPTLAIGDLGNEIGFGRLADAAREILPDAGACCCGCGGGIIAGTPVDILLPAAVSNWGAYGVAAALAILADEPEAALQPDEEARMLHVAAVRGCRDGVRRRGAYGVDGLAGDVSVRLVEALQSIVERGA